MQSGLSNLQNYERQLKQTDGIVNEQLTKLEGNFITAKEPQPVSDMSLKKAGHPKLPGKFKQRRTKHRISKAGRSLKVVSRDLH
jgi:hypothetical protein